MKLKTFEAQSRLSVLLAIVATLLTVAAAVLIATRFDPESFAVVIRARGARFFAIVGATAVAILLGLTGFFVGLNSAGQKRNKDSRLAWIGFFGNAAILTLALCLFVFFFLAKVGVN